ncbi:Ff.00g079660.m01.CDS01 [Fusarium sp. VM40]|nr:Ff.00g079660.m01.CDS01 [Fusarium sp. VM40]
MLPITTCFVAGLQYLIHPLKLGTIQETINPDALIPVTLLTTEELFGDLEGILDLFDSYDDVFVPDFGSILVEKTGDNSSQVRGNARQVYHMDQVKALDGFSELPSGPYFLYGPNLHQAWRLYDDELGAFTFGIVPDDLGKPDEFQPLTSSSVLGDSVTVPVPSRLYHPRPSPKKPFSGMRVSISDTISVKGTHTTFSSRAWKSLYKEASSNTAKYAQNLLDQGAVIIGKTKTSQFGTGAEWIDQQAPWSARGDGYNSMKGGSVGAAAALVGYPWLDHSIGVDDGRVVSEDGVYSLSRPANLSTDHVTTTSKYDKTRLFSRTLKGLLDLTASPKGELPENVSLTKIVVPIDLNTPDETQEKAIDDFVSILEDHLNVKADRIDVGKAWKRNPAEASKETMQTYMSQAPFRSWCYDYYHAFDDFRDEYRKRFHNEPFAEATPQYFWNQCKTVTEEEHRKDTGRIEIYRRWFDENILGSSTPNAKSAIVILPCGNPKVEHRNEPVAPPAIYKGIDHTTLAPVLGGSVLSFPFTQVPYKSAISGKTEYRPVCISVLSIQGNDQLVIQLIQKALAKKRIPTEVEIGRFTFPVKEADLSSHLQSPLLVQD